MAAPLIYEKRKVLPKESAILQKVSKQFPFNKSNYYTKIQQANTGHKVNRLLKDALAAQAERHDKDMNDKDAMIER